MEEYDNKCHDEDAWGPPSIRRRSRNEAASSLLEQRSGSCDHREGQSRLRQLPQPISKNGGGYIAIETAITSDTTSDIDNAIEIWDKDAIWAIETAITKAIDNATVVWAIETAITDEAEKTDLVSEAAPESIGRAQVELAQCQVLNLKKEVCDKWVSTKRQAVDNHLRGPEHKQDAFMCKHCKKPNKSLQAQIYHELKSCKKIKKVVEVKRLQRRKN